MRKTLFCLFIAFTLVFISMSYGRDGKSTNPFDDMMAMKGSFIPGQNGDYYCQTEAGSFTYVILWSPELNTIGIAKGKGFEVVSVCRVTKKEGIVYAVILSPNINELGSGLTIFITKAEAIQIAKRFMKEANFQKEQKI